MMKVTIRQGDATFEVSDLTLADLRELVGLNGHSRNGHGTRETPQRETVGAKTEIYARMEIPDFKGFYKTLNDRGRKFCDILSKHAEGISAEDLANELGFQNANQIGGLTGGGLAKVARDHDINLDDVYTTKVSFPQGQRTRQYWPGKLLLKVEKTS